MENYAHSLNLLAFHGHRAILSIPGGEKSYAQKVKEAHIQQKKP